MKTKPAWLAVVHYVTCTCIFVSLSIISGQLGFLSPEGVHRATPVWAHTGLYLALYCMWGYRAFPTIIISAIATNHLLASRPFAISAVLTVTHIIGAALAAKVLRPLQQQDADRHYFSEMPRIVLAAAIMPFINAIVGTIYVSTKDHLPLAKALTVFGTWWTGMFLGVILVTPLALEWWRQEKLSRSDLYKFALIGVFSIPLLHAIFFTTGGYSFIFGVFPLLFVAAWTLPRQLFLTINFAINVVALSATYSGIGAFRSGSMGGNLINLQIFLGTVSITAIALEGFRQRSFRLSPILTLACGWLLSGAIYYLFTQNQAEKDTARAKYFADSLIRDLSAYMSIHIDILHLSRSLLSNIDHFDQARWQSFVEQITMSTNYPSLRNLGIAFALVPHQGDKFVRFMRKHSSSDFQIFPKNSDKNRRLVISFIAPEGKFNADFIGFDVMSLGEAAQNAIDSTLSQGAPHLMAALTSHPSQTENLSMYSLCMPFYGVGTLIRDRGLESREGLLFASIDMEKFFAGLVNRRPREMAIEVFDNDLGTGDSLFTSNTEALRPGANYEFLTPVTLANHRFTIGWRRSQFFPSTRDSSSVILSSTTTLLSLFIAAMIANLQTVRERAERIADEKTRELDKQRAVSIHSAKMASLGEMAGGIAHEINNPLAIIHGMSQILQDKISKNMPTQEQLLQGIKLIEQTSLRISKIIAGLRTFSRSSMNDPLLPEDVTTIIEQTLSLCKERFKAANITLEVSTTPNIKIDCRATQISQVLLNLLSNSYDAVLDTPNSWVRIDVEDRDAFVAIMVTDSGTKIAESARQKIFQPFFTTKEDRHGTGLGLSIAHGLAEAHKGKLYLDESYPNTRFVLVLPKSLKRNSA